jgi:hypothetical protein
VEFSQQFDVYCERLGPGFWAEPVNALTNLAFVLAAIWMAGRLRGSGLRLAWGLVVLLGLIGAGSFLFHSFATGWAALADVIAIAAFVLVFVFATHRDIIGGPRWTAWLAVPGFVIFAALSGQVFAALPPFAVSAAYWPVVLALVLYAVALRRQRAVARGFGVGAAILTLSLIARSIDMTLCDALPVGTHFAWHLLNAVMLVWMIEVYRRHMLAGAPRRG